LGCSGSGRDLTCSPTTPPTRSSPPPAVTSVTSFTAAAALTPAKASAFFEFFLLCASPLCADAALSHALPCLEFARRPVVWPVRDRFPSSPPCRPAPRDAPPAPSPPLSPPSCPPPPLPPPPLPPRPPQASGGDSRAAPLPASDATTALARASTCPRDNKTRLGFRV